jgi:hypothetical protein
LFRDVYKNAVNRSEKEMIHLPRLTSFPYYLRPYYYYFV